MLSPHPIHSRTDHQNSTNHEKPALQTDGVPLFWAAGHVSPRSQAKLLDIVLDGYTYGYAAVAVAGLPFIAWRAHIDQEVGSLALWSLLYFIATVVIFWLSRCYHRERTNETHKETVERWIPVVKLIAFIYGLGLVFPPLLTFQETNFEFQLLYLGAVAAVVAGNAVHSSPIRSTFYYFFIPGWGGVTLLTPLTFPDHWHYVLPLTLAYIPAILKHSELSHRFFIQTTSMKEESERLAEKFRSASEIAEKALHDKSVFLTTASHDLRQPIHAMGFLIESIACRNSDTSLVPALNDLRHSVQSVTLMFNSLLDLSRIESRSVHVQCAPVSLNPLINDVVMLFRKEADSRNLRLTAHIARNDFPVVLADNLLLRQSLINLVHNALRYTLKGGVLIGARRRGDTWRLEVWDTGIGIASTDKPHVHSPYFRDANAWRIDSAGHGLGLAVVARCAELMGATHGFDSIQKRGSRFWLQLPAFIIGEPADAAATRTKRMSVQTAPKLCGNVLVVDDDPQVIQAWQSLMAAWGIDVRCADSAISALALIDSGFLPQAILCDQRLRSGDSGIEILKALFARCPSAGGAMVSGEFASEELAQAEAEGYLVLRKPLDPNQLETLLAGLLMSCD